MIVDFLKENPMYTTTKSGIKVSLWADAQDLLTNYSFAVRMLKDLKKEIQIAPHIQGGQKNPEYVINGLVSDLVTIETVNVKGGFRNAFKRKSEQMSEAPSYGIVLDLDLVKTMDTVTIARHLFGELKAHKRCQAVIIGIKKVVEILQTDGYEDVLKKVKKAKGD